MPSWENARSHNTSSEECWNIATQWMSRCLYTHTRCHETLERSWLPTRLLQVSRDESSEMKVRLICTAAEPPMQRRYMTLSHCWGRAQIVKLLRSNFDMMTRDIPIADLPKTFQDAITVTQRLGISYLWIDSLCILQDRDDLSDWEAEASLMHKVYSHSYCNISAAAAEDSFEGLFYPRDPRLLHAAEVDLCIREFVSDVDAIRCHVFYRGFWFEHSTQAPLNKRAWVLQERLLSPRILHFGRHQLLWECRELQAAESAPWGIDTDLDGRNFCRLRLRQQTLRQETLTTDPTILRYNQYRAWHKLVKIYSRCFLTVPDDKLIAISALAKRTGEATKGQYIAGLWREVLEKELLWCRGVDQHSKAMLSCRSPRYRAPTCKCSLSQK